MEKKVQIPAIGLMVLGILGLLGSALGLLQGAIEPQSFIDAGMPEEDARRFAELWSGPLIIVMSLGGMLIGAFVAWAGFQMLKLKSWTACVIANILVMAPWSCCCVVGIPFGIWGLVVLFNADVKRAFEVGPPSPGFTT
jgi:hypothetical protein